MQLLKTILAVALLLGSLSARFMAPEPADNVFYLDCTSSYQNEHGQTSMCCNQVKSIYLQVPVDSPGVTAMGGFIADLQGGYKYCQCLLNDSRVIETISIAHGADRCICTNIKDYDMRAAKPPQCPSIVPDVLPFMLSVCVALVFSFVFIASVLSKVKISPDMRILVAVVSLMIVVLTIVANPGAPVTVRYPNIPGWFFLPFAAAFVAFLILQTRIDKWIESRLSKKSR